MLSKKIKNIKKISRSTRSNKFKEIKRLKIWDVNIPDELEQRLVHVHLILKANYLNNLFRHWF